MNKSNRLNLKYVCQTDLFLVVGNDRNACIYQAVKLFGFRYGHIYAAVGTTVTVDGTSEASAPGSIMKAAAIIERHPVGNGRCVITPAQNNVPGLIHDAEDTGRGSSSAAGISGYTIGSKYDISVLYKVDLLVGHINFQISIAVLVS
jgi:hypothetical protein